MSEFDRSTDISSTDDSSLWTAYTYAQQPHPDPSTSCDLSSSSNFSLASDYPLPANDRTGSNNGLNDGGQYPLEGQGLGFDTYLDGSTTTSFHPSHLDFSDQSFAGLLPSPSLPGLSSADSTPSSSSALLTPYGPPETTPPNAGLLLPAAAIGGEFVTSGASSASSCFARLQESYLQRYDDVQGQDDGRQTMEPSSHALAISTSAPPSTPRRNQPSASQLWRSPSSHSVTSSPSKSPYVHRAKPYDRPLDSSPTKDPSPFFDPSSTPTRTIVRRNFPTTQQQVDERSTSQSPTRGGRRQGTKLSIDVPTRYGLRSTLPIIEASPQVPMNDEKFATPDDLLVSGGLPADPELSQATLQQVEELLQEFAPMSSTSSYSTFSQSVNGQPMTQDGSNDTRYCVSGVALSLEDLAQLDDPALTAAFDSTSLHNYPASAPPYQTSFQVPHFPPSTSHYSHSVTSHPSDTSSPNYLYTSSYPSSPVYEPFVPTPNLSVPSNNYQSHIRSVSAPRTSYYPTARDLAALPSYPPVSQSLVPTHSTHSLPSRSSPPRPQYSLQSQQRRRRSSIATDSPSTSSSSWSHHPPRPVPPPTSFSYGPPPASSPSHQHSLYHNVPLPLRPAPPPGTTYQDISPPTSPTKPTPASPSKAARESGGAPSSPTKRKKAAGGGKGRNPHAMFVNFSAADAKKLLSGVAPSGSSKKKREEEEAAKIAQGSSLPSTSGSAQEQSQSSQ